MGVSKVNYGSKTLIDLTGDTVTANKLLSGYKAHNKAGNAITGTCTYDCDSSDATAGIYDIYKDKTAYVNGSKVTGAYNYIYPQVSRNSSGCSSTKLVIPCDFIPKGCAVVYNHDKYVSDTVICFWTDLHYKVYHSYTGIGLVRSISTSSSYAYYDSETKKFIINRPTSSYSWSSNKYRVFIFR